MKRVSTTVLALVGGIDERRRKLAGALAAGANVRAALPDRVHLHEPAHFDQRDAVHR